MYEGKSALFDFITSKIDITYISSKIDMVGKEHCKLLKDISRVFVRQRCLSEHCPKQDDNIRHIFILFNLY